MVSIAKSQILPAALEHQRRMAEAVAATKAAGVDATDSTQALREFVDLVTQFRARTAEVGAPGGASRVGPGAGMPPRSRGSSSRRWPRLRETGDALEAVVAADLWPLPSYRTLLFLK